MLVTKPTASTGRVEREHLSRKHRLPELQPAGGAVNHHRSVGRQASRVLNLCCLLVAVASCWTARAYPPSPYHLIYGVVRDEYGTPVMNDSVQVLLVATNGTQSRTFIEPSLAIGVNYQLRVPIDALRKPDVYRPDALMVGAGFKMFVIVGNTTNIPMVSVGSVTNLGDPAKTTQIDLTLGTDSNRDGIPDEWELAFLAALGSNLTLDDLNANSDVARNGRTLMEEYLLGAAAFEQPGGFAVRMVAFNSGAPLLEFPAASGSSYSVLGSTNLQHWATLSFRLSSEGVSGPTRTIYASTADQPLQVQIVPASPGPNAQFFRILQQ